MARQWLFVVVNDWSAATLYAFPEPEVEPEFTFQNVVSNVSQSL